MTDPEQGIDWTKTTFDGSRREQLRKTLAMTIRQRLEALEQLSLLSARMQAMKRYDPSTSPPGGLKETAKTDGFVHCFRRSIEISGK